MGAGVFVSYRKDDDPGWAGRVRDALAGHFGDDQVFFDVDSIRGGERWEEALDGALAASRALVLIVGPRWVACLEERGAQPEVDYHLREITMALDRGVPIFPVRVHGAPMPDLSALPAVLRDRLPAIQWSSIHEDLFRPSIERVLTELERATGVGRRSTLAGAAAAEGAASTGGPRPEVTVGPWDAEADVHEIADAVALVAPGGRIRVRPGRYLKPVVIDRPLAIVAEGGGDVLLDTDEVPCIRSTSAGAVLRGVRIRSTAREGGVGVAVEGGDLTIDGVQIAFARRTGAVGIAVGGSTPDGASDAVGAQAVVLGTEVGAAAIGLDAGAGARVRVERAVIVDVDDHAVRVAGGSVSLTGCTLGGGVTATVLVAGGSFGLDDSSIAPGAAAAALTVAGEGEVAVRGSRSAATPGAIGSVAGRVARAVPGVRPPVDDAARGGWVIEVGPGGGGIVEDADLAAVRAGGGVTFRSCAIGSVVARDGSADVFAEGSIEQVVLERGASPTFTGCTVAPERGVKVTVDAEAGSRATFESCEVVGRNVRDGSADPAIRCAGADLVIRGGSVRNPGEGALWVEAGRVEASGVEVRSSVSGPAVVVRGGSAELTDAQVHGGVRVEGDGVVVLHGGALPADPVSGQVAVGRGGGRLEGTDVEVRGAGFAKARKVGRWIESRSEKVGSTAARLLGATRPIAIEAGSHARFVRCAFVGVELNAGSGDEVELEACTADGEPVAGSPT